MMNQSVLRPNPGDNLSPQDYNLAIKEVSDKLSVQRKIAEDPYTNDFVRHLPSQEFRGEESLKYNPLTFMPSLQLTLPKNILNDL